MPPPTKGHPSPGSHSSFLWQAEGTTKGSKPPCPQALPEGLFGGELNRLFLTPRDAFPPLLQKLHSLHKPFPIWCEKTMAAFGGWGPQCCFSYYHLSLFPALPPVDKDPRDPISGSQHPCATRGHIKPLDVIARNSNQPNRAQGIGYTRESGLEGKTCSGPFILPYTALGDGQRPKKVPGESESLETSDLLLTQSHNGNSPHCQSPSF